MVCMVVMIYLDILGEVWDMVEKGYFLVEDYWFFVDFIFMGDRKMIILIFKDFLNFVV